MIRICTFLWGTKYTHEHVLRLGRALARNLTIPYEFVLISDQAPHDQMLLEDQDGAPTRYLSLLDEQWDATRNAKLCGIRLRAFGEDMGAIIGPRFCWIDLDVVITGNVDHIFGRTEPFMALATPQGPLWYNGSLVMMDAGARAEVYEAFDPVEYAKLPALYAKAGMVHGGQSDEGWMTYMLGQGEATVGRAEGVWYFKHIAGMRDLPPDTRMVVMNGRRFDPSMASWQRTSPWLLEHWK